MLFIATCFDKPDSSDKRVAQRPAHLDYLQSLGTRVRVGGAMLDKDLKTPIGSMLIYEGESEAEVQAMVSRDPFMLSGLFETVRIIPWRQGVGQAMA
jgi:uncharacterized protein